MKKAETCKSEKDKGKMSTVEIYMQMLCIF